MSPNQLWIHGLHRIAVSGSISDSRFCRCEYELFHLLSVFGRFLLEGFLWIFLEGSLSLWNRLG